jgi:hypothetical protein
MRVLVLLVLLLLVLVAASAHGACPQKDQTWTTQSLTGEASLSWKECSSCGVGGTAQLCSELALTFTGTAWIGLGPTEAAPVSNQMDNAYQVTVEAPNSSFVSYFTRYSAAAGRPSLVSSYAIERGPWTNNGGTLTAAFGRSNRINLGGSTTIIWAYNPGPNGLAANNLIQKHVVKGVGCLDLASNVFQAGVCPPPSPTTGAPTTGAPTTGAPTTGTTTDPTTGFSTTGVDNPGVSTTGVPPTTGSPRDTTGVDIFPASMATTESETDGAVVAGIVIICVFVVLGAAAVLWVKLREQGSSSSSSSNQGSTSSDKTSIPSDSEIASSTEGQMSS